MNLLSQDMKQEMEKCKKIAREAGLQFQDNTLEYIISNRDMLELKPKIMIPTLYDYWVHDLGAIHNKWIYDVYPNNPYETVINTRPAISFYNQDNADWFNVMIFYHVLGHIDYFQNNVFYRNTWDDDFIGQALADKRIINRIRQELGTEKRWVDYVIEFSRAIDNLVGYYSELKETEQQDSPGMFGIVSEKIDFYFGRFLRHLHDDDRLEINFYFDEVDRFNQCMKRFGQKQGEIEFFEDNRLRGKFPEFSDTFKKWKEKEKKPKPKDIFEYLWEHSEFLNKEENKWMKDVMQVVRRTSLYFQPQIRSGIASEGWASLWHERLFVPDERIQTHEINYAIVDSGVVTPPRVGFNPYATGKQLFEFIEDLARKGKLSPKYQLIKNMEERKDYNRQLGNAYGKQVLFEARKYLNDERLINFLSDEDFQDFVNKYRLFIVGIRPHRQKWDKAEVYIKSKSGKDYRELLNKYLYHPPHIIIKEDMTSDDVLYLEHVYEGRSLVTKHIQSALIGLEFLSGKQVSLETTEYEEVHADYRDWRELGLDDSKYKIVRVLYTCKNRNIKRLVI